MEKNMNKNVCRCLTATLCYTVEINTTLSQLYFNDFFFFNEERWCFNFPLLMEYFSANFTTSTAHAQYLLSGGQKLNTGLTGSNWAVSGAPEVLGTNCSHPFQHPAVAPLSWLMVLSPSPKPVTLHLGPISIASTFSDHSWERDSDFKHLWFHSAHQDHPGSSRMTRSFTQSHRPSPFCHIRSQTRRFQEPGRGRLG